MDRSYFEPGAQRAAKVGELFARIAPRYDLMNDLQSFGLHRYWKRRLLQMAKPRAGERALDVCCGTGDLALALARRGLQVVGLDFSESMLAVAQRRQRAMTNGSGRPRQSAVRTAHWVCGDALQMPLSEGAFDIVTIGYGLRNLANWETGLREMQRVAKPGGRILVLDFGKPDNALWRGCYFGYLRFFVPLLGRLVCGNASAYAYILESLENYPGQHGIEAKMLAMGMERVQTQNLMGGIMSISYGQKGTGRLE